MYTERQQEIINKSIEIIATKGIQGLTIKNLSKEIGVSEPAIYRHFENGKSRMQAAIDGTMEVLPAIFSAILTTMVAFSAFFL